MPIEIKMPALSPTMEEGTLAKWLVKPGDTVASGDIIAEIETDKATMEFEAVDEGVIIALLVPEGEDGVKVGTTIVTLGVDGEAVASTPADEPKVEAAPEPAVERASPEPVEAPDVDEASASPPSAETPTPRAFRNDRIDASVLARRLAGQLGIDLESVNGTGHNGRIMTADVQALRPGKPRAAASAPQPTQADAVIPATQVEATPPDGVPFEAVKLSNMRKTIARRLSRSKQTIPHIYLTVDVRLDALLKLRTELNEALVARDCKLSINDMLIKAQALALMATPAVNVMYAGDTLFEFQRADISVAVSIPSGLITPIVESADSKSLSAIAMEMKSLASRARDGKLQPDEYQGGTASLSNMGMYGIKQFEAVINPPQAMILAIGAGERRPWVEDEQLIVATVMSATGSFDHRAIDGADGASFMRAFKEIVENPLALTV